MSITRLCRTSVAVAVACSAFITAPSLARTTRHFSGLDRKWLTTSIEGDRFEIIGGTYAVAQGSTATVKALGQRLATDHSKSLKDSIAQARRLGIKVPSAPSHTQEWELAVIHSLAGASFNHWYSFLEVEDHKQDIIETEEEVHSGTNPKVRKLAAEDLPVLTTHLTLAIKALAASP
jgi:putative membrane protein